MRALHDVHTSQGAALSQLRTAGSESTPLSICGSGLRGAGGGSDGLVHRRAVGTAPGSRLHPFPAGFHPGGEHAGVFQPDQHPLHHFALLRALGLGQAGAGGQEPATKGLKEQDGRQKEFLPFPAAVTTLENGMRVVS